MSQSRTVAIFSYAVGKPVQRIKDLPLLRGGFAYSFN
jgi:hypothetical protein